MKTIFKYPLHIIREQKVTLPIRAKILTVQLQNDVPYLWALVDDKEQVKEERTIYIYGTGHLIEEEEFNFSGYISTFQTKDHALVFHAFERYT